MQKKRSTSANVLMRSNPRNIMGPGSSGLAYEHLAASEVGDPWPMLAVYFGIIVLLMLIGRFKR